MIMRPLVPRALCALVCLSSIPSPAEDLDAKKTVATVNGEPITLAEVTAAVPSADRSSTEARKAALEKLIDKTLLVQAARKKMKEPPTKFVDERIQAIVDQEFHGDQAAFEATLQKQDFTLEMFKKFQETEILVQIMRRVICGAETNPAAKDQQIADWLTAARAEAKITYE